MLFILLVLFKSSHAATAPPFCKAYVGEVCNQCLDGYELNADKLGCGNTCSTGYDHLGKFCVKTACTVGEGNCEACGDSGCSTCSAGFKLEKTTTNINVCYSCKDEYEIKDALTNGGIIKINERQCIINDCVANSNHCKTCDADDPKSCEKCEAGYAMNSNADAEHHRCVECATDYEKDTTSTKLSCKLKCNVEHCTTCIGNPQTCDTCQTGYSVSNGQCEKITCYDNCLICFSTTRCKTCKSPYATDSNNKCENCIVGYEKDPTKETFTCRKIDCSGIANCKTCGSSSDVCRECNTPYDVDQNNKCEKCVNGYEKDPTKETFTCRKIDCSGIENCLSCGDSSDICRSCKSPYAVDENNKCENCQKDYVKDPSKEKFTCIPDCTDIPHCIKCSYLPHQCEICETGYENVDNRQNSKCSRCAPGYREVKDAEVFTCELTPKCNVDNCDECTYEDVNKCETCKSGYIKDKNAQCYEECYEVSEKNAFYGACKKCSDDKTLCENCYESEKYFPNSKGSCSPKCYPGEDYCKKCNDDIPSLCDECSIEGLEIDDYRCRCKRGYDLVNGECVEELKALKVEYPENLVEFTSNEFNDETMIIDTSKIENYDQLEYYTEKILDDAKKAVIKNKNNANLYLDLPHTITISAEDDSTKATLYCKYKNSVLKLENSNNLTVVAYDRITMDNPGSGWSKGVNIGKLIVDSNVELNVANFKINELHIFNKGEIKHENAFNIETVKIQQGAIFSQDKYIDSFDKMISIKNIEIGINAMYDISPNWKDSNIIIYYYRQADDVNYIPLGGYTEKNLPSSLTIKKGDTNKELDDDVQDKFVIHQISFYDDEENTQSIFFRDFYNKLIPLYDNADSPYGKLFINEINKKGGQTVMQLVAEKAQGGQNGKDDGSKGGNGLSGGAIAGIVIACVVVAAGVGVLVWYFAFYKKKVGVSADEAEP